MIGLELLKAVRERGRLGSEWPSANSRSTWGLTVARPRLDHALRTAGSNSFGVQVKNAGDHHAWTLTHRTQPEALPALIGERGPQVISAADAPSAIGLARVEDNPPTGSEV
jgi:hypothetical protein